ncbi:STAS domain-containing protein [Rhodococcus gannanensis]|uniref:Anti-sigma factor antagonist n=1 Tax=Rhodococcus gannanensis TaxID=1960308 RepID=A0ABW4P289_9NOCA
MENQEPSTTPDLPYEVEITDGIAVVRFRGEIDVLTAPAFQSAIESASARDRSTALVVDMAGVTFLASAGLAVLARCSDDTDRSGRLLVVAQGPATLRPLELTGLMESLEVFPSVEAALATV